MDKTHKKYLILPRISVAKFKMGLQKKIFFWLPDTIRDTIAVIGQVQRDTALYLFPPLVTETRRGRPRKYGERITFERFKELCPLMEQKIAAYGKEHLFQFYALDIEVRFPVRALWNLKEQKMEIPKDIMTPLLRDVA